MVEAHQQILAAPVDAHQSLPFERRGEIGGHRLAQATLANAAAPLADQEAARAVLAQWSSAPRLGEWVLSVNLPAMSITIALTVLLFLGIRESARANAVMVVLKLALVAIFIGLGFWAILHKGENHWTPFAPNGFKGIWQGAALGFFSYIGFDAVSTAGEECKNPQRDLPIGMIASLLICTVLYILTAAALTGVVPYELIKTNDPLAQAMEFMGYTNFATVFAFGAVIAMTLSRYSRSRRNWLSRTIVSRSRLVAATMRTLARKSLVPPSRRKNPDSSTRNSLA